MPLPLELETPHAHITIVSAVIITIISTIISPQGWEAERPPWLTHLPSFQSALQLHLELVSATEHLDTAQTESTFLDAFLRIPH